MADPICPAEVMALAAWIARGLTESQWREGLHDYERKRFIDAQRAALRALAEMEPTEKMERCADAEMAEPHAFGWAVARAAIRAALKEQANG